MILLKVNIYTLIINTAIVKELKYMKSTKVIETLLELATNEIPVNYNSLVNTFNNDKFKIIYANKQYAKRVINCYGIYTSMLQMRINKTNKTIVLLMVHYNNHNYKHDIDTKKDSVLIVYMRCDMEVLFDNSKYVNC